MAGTKTKPTLKQCLYLNKLADIDLLRVPICLLVLLGAFHRVSAEDIAGTFSVPPGAKTFYVGKIKVSVLHDGRYIEANDGKSFGVDAGATAVGEVLRAAGLPTDRITLSVNTLLVHSGRRVLLLDTGLGIKDHGVMLASLKVAGVSPAAVTDVLITHSHGDHVGGLVDATGHLAFPKATVRMTIAEWDWFQKQGPAQIVGVIANHVRTFAPGARIAPGVTSVALTGHTPGHVGYEIASGSSRMLDIGDLAHSSIISLQKPLWTNAYDNDAAAGKEIRQQTLGRLAQDRELVFSPHFPYPGIGHIVSTGDGFTWMPQAP